jgi:hypothetical protein
VLTVLAVIVIQFMASLPQFLVAYNMSNKQLDSLEWQLGRMVSNRIASKADAIIDGIIHPARDIQFYDEFLLECNMPVDGTYWPYSLVSGYNAHTEVLGRLARKFDLESLGILMRTSPSAHVKTEYTWEIASHPNCTDYAYVYSDDTTNNKLLGWCGLRNGTIEGPQVLETDAPRLSPVEEEIFDGIPGTEAGAFLPIEFSWLGSDVFTLIYEVPFRCSNGATSVDSEDEENTSVPIYAATYAEKSLAQIDAILKESAAEEQYSTYYIVEIDTNYLVASSLPNQTTALDKKGQRTRVLFFDAPNALIRKSAWFLKAKAGAHGLRYYDLANVYRYEDADVDLLIYVHPYKSATMGASGIQWLIVRIVPAKVVYGEIETLARTSVVVFIVMTLLAVIVTLFVVRICMRAFRKALEEDEVDLKGICISEFRDIATNVRRLRGPSATRLGSASILNSGLDDIAMTPLNGGGIEAGEKNA